MEAAARLSESEYLERELRSEIRHEYVDGKLLAMAGETKRHEEIVLNIALALRPKAKALGCRLQTKTIQLRVSNSRYRYPDVMVNCLDNSDPRIEETPCFLLEVISESSADTDSNKKLAEYTRIPSVQRYVLLEQDSRLAVVYKRQNDVWLVETLEGDGEIDIPCLGVGLTLEQVYDGLEF
jgi:Uma2 family endonuclease